MKQSEIDSIEGHLKQAAIAMNEAFAILRKLKGGGDS